VDQERGWTVIILSLRARSRALFSLKGVGELMRNTN
jgi:hypothetical protein